MFNLLVYFENIYFKDANERKDFIKTSVKEDLAPKLKSSIICAYCGITLASLKDKSQKDGAFEHVFVNPSGLVYRIGIFSKLQHILTYGIPETFFTWFPGYSWDCIYCAFCFSHLGWLFQSNKDESFYGVILNNIKGY